jgi:hypothetical protein
MRGKEFGHFKHSDLRLAENWFQLGVSVDVAFVRRILQVVRLDIFPNFLRDFSARGGLAANDGSQCVFR